MSFNKNRVICRLNRRSLLLQLCSTLSSLLPLPLPAPLWARASLLRLCLHEFSSRNLREAATEARGYFPPSPLHFSQHGYNCNLDQIHRRISAVWGTRKVSDSSVSHRCCCSCCIQSVRACVRVFMRVCVWVCLHVFLLSAAAAAIVRVYFSVDKAGEGLSKNREG